MDGQGLSVCGICGHEPCICTEVAKMVILEYKVGGDVFRVHVPLSLVKMYRSLYKEITVMSADGSMVVYSGGVVEEKV